MENWDFGMNALFSELSRCLMAVTIGYFVGSFYGAPPYIIAWIGTPLLYPAD